MPFFFRRQLKDKKESKDDSKFVWHSNVGAGNKSEGKKKKKKNNIGRRRNVTFNKVEVQEFYFDKEDFPNQFYSRPELQVFNQSRFDDASKLRRKHEALYAESGAKDDIDAMNPKNTGDDLDTVLIKAYADPDTDDDMTIRGIEHFVYSLLQKEMIARKKQVQREVIDFANSKQKDPQGWRISETSKLHSQWARDVATERGFRYAEQQSKQAAAFVESDSDHDIGSSADDAFDEIGDTGARTRLRRSRRQDSKFRASMH